jgi:hypothetical protein
MGLEVVRQRCAGTDVHKRQVTVHVQVPGRGETREFPADTGSLLVMVDWLQELKIDDVAMEATGAYWKPVYNLLPAGSRRHAADRGQRQPHEGGPGAEDGHQGRRMDL